MSTTIEFVGFSPEHPSGRVMSIWREMPVKNRTEDVTLDLRRFANCLEEVFRLLLIHVDRFTELFDPDLCTDAVIDDMLVDMGNPFDWEELDLSAAEKRKLLLVLVEIYKQKGTDPGIENTILLLLGLDVSVVEYMAEGWVLGVDALGEGNIAQIDNFTVAPWDFTTVAQPWRLSFSIDGGAVQTVDFVPGDFSNTAAVEASEVSTVISAQLAGGDSYVVNDGEAAFLVGGSAPFVLSGGESLWLEVDGVSQQVVFQSTDFSVPGVATMAEVQRVISLIPGVFVDENPSGNLVIYTKYRDDLATLTSVNDPLNTASVLLGIALGSTDAGADGQRLYVYSETVDRDASVDFTSPGTSIDELLKFWVNGAAGTGSSVLAPSESSTLYSFDIETAIEITDATTLALIRRIADYMKVAHTHLVNIRPAPDLPWPDGWRIGVDALNEGTELAE